MSQIQLNNPHLASRENDHNDILYHLALSRENHDLKAMFGDVKVVLIMFVCMGGTKSRMLQFIRHITQVLNLPWPECGEFTDHAQSAGRYSLYKNGPVIAVSHGIGFSSISILLNEILKLIHYAGCKDVRLFRIGTCGGIGVTPGTVVVSQSCVDGLLRGFYELAILGHQVQREAVLDQELCEDLQQCSRRGDNFKVMSGITMSAVDFYEGQGRLDGAFCEFTIEEKLAYFQSLHKKGVVNIEMEGIVLAAMCHRAGIKAAVVCVTFLDRLLGDQVNVDKDHVEWEQRPLTIVGRYILKQCNASDSHTKNI